MNINSTPVLNMIDDQQQQQQQQLVHHQQIGHHQQTHHDHQQQQYYANANTPTYYQSNSNDSYLNDSHSQQIHGDNLTFHSTSHQSTHNENNKQQQTSIRKSHQLSTPSSSSQQQQQQQQSYSLALSMASDVSPVLPQHNNNLAVTTSFMTPSPTSMSSLNTGIQQQQQTITFNNNNNCNENHVYDMSPTITTVTYPSDSPIGVMSSSPSPSQMISDGSASTMMMNPHHHLIHTHNQSNYLNKNISTSLTHISDTASDTNTNYNLTPPLPQQTTNLNNHKQIIHGNHNSLKNSAQNNFHESSNWNHHSHHIHQQQRHPITADTSLPSINAQHQSRFKSSNHTYLAQQQKPMDNDCFPFMEPQQQNSGQQIQQYNTTTSMASINSNKNDNLIKTAIMNRKILNHNHQQQYLPINTNEDGSKLMISKHNDNDDNNNNNDMINDTKNNQLFERRHLIVFKVIEQLVDTSTKTVVKENVKKNEQCIIDVGFTTINDWNNQRNDNNENAHNITLSSISNRSHTTHTGSSGLFADVSSLTVDTKSPCSNSVSSENFFIAKTVNDVGQTSANSSIDLIKEENKAIAEQTIVLQQNQQPKQKSKESKKSISTKIDENEDKEAASALLSLQKTPVKSSKSPTRASDIDLISSTPSNCGNDSSTKKFTNVENKNIVIERIRPGMKIMAKWMDKNFYPAEIVKKNETHRWQVRFEDNATRNLFENEIIRIEHLGEQPKQELMVKISDELCKASIIKKLIKLDDNKNYVFELEHSDEDDGTKVIKRYPLKDVFLYSEQGNILLNRYAKQTMMATVFADVDLDNIVSGKRSRNTKQNNRKNSALNNVVNDSTDTASDSTTSISSKKRKTTSTNTNNINKDTDQNQLINSNSNNNNNKINKNLNSLKIATNRLPSTVGHYHERSLALSPPPIRSARSIELTIPKNELEKIFGPIPKSDSKLFRNIAFILTCGNNFQNNSNNDNNGVIDPNDSDSNPECSTPFDKTYLIKQIVNGGGKVYETYEEMKKSSNECVCIADTYSRSIKFIQCLAGGVSIVSHQWIIDCCRQNRILDRESYTLPAGYSIITNALSSDKNTFKKSSLLFKGAKFYFGSDQPEKLQQLWSPVLLAAQAIIVKNDANIHKSLQRGQIDIIIGDTSCPTSLINKAKQLKIPIVASEYIVQCLINGRKLPFDASPSFSYLHK